jgi:hypothetical protein
MQALSLEFLTFTGLGKENLLQFIHFASGSLGLQPSNIRLLSCRSQQKLNDLPRLKDAWQDA